MSQAVLQAFQEALAEELEALHQQILELVEPLSEEQFYRKPIEPGNSVGHLVLHLTGNLNHFAGARLGGTGYIRDREREFTDPAPPPKAVALANLAEAVVVYRRVIENLSNQQLLQAPVDAHLGPTIAAAMVRLVSHFALHRGQISYLVRLVRS
ncbi:MAG: DinB family protein [Gemmataceae bacterium]